MLIYTYSSMDGQVHAIAGPLEHEGEVPEDETSDPPPYDPSSMSWESTSDYGAQIAHWERQRWAQFHAAIATSSGDTGVLGNFPQEVEQELKEQELKQKVEQLIDLLAEKDALLAEKDEWTEALEEELQLKEQEIINLNKEITWRDLQIGPPAPLRPPSLN